MTYKDWCESSKAILAEAEKFNKWQDKAKDNLLIKIGPRIAKLGKTGYMGCGFHYDMEIRFGKLVASLALPWQPCANHCDEVESDRTSGIISKVLYKSLIEQVKEAEKTV
jgi:hypothetical protein